MKMFSMLIATAVAMSALACGGEDVIEICNDNTRTETVVVIKTTTITETRTTTIVEVQTATVVVVETATVVITETTTVAAPEMSVTGTVTAHNLPSPTYISYAIVPFSSAAYILPYTIQTNMDGVLRRLEVPVSGPGTHPEAFVQECRWNIVMLGISTLAPCTVDNGHVVMAHDLFIPQGVVVEATLYISANAFAETGSYILPLTNVVMDDGHGSGAFHFEEGGEVHPQRFFTSQDQVCQTLSTSVRQEAATFMANFPQAGAGVVDIQQGTRGTVIDLSIHSCTMYGAPQFRVIMSHVNWGQTTTDGGTGFFHANGTVRRIVAYETHNVTSPNTGWGTNTMSLFVPGSQDQAEYRLPFSVVFGGDTSYQMQLDCTDLPLNEEYEVRVEVSISHIVNPTDRVFTSRFRCVE